MTLPLRSIRSMPSATDQKRITCATCLRPQAACICRWVAPVANDVDVLILQHPLEVHSAKGTARLLHLSLPRSRLVLGEVFDVPQLHGLLHAPWSGAATPDASVQPILLYPETPGAPPSTPVDQAMLQVPARLRLVVIDGTWRKSRKMLYLNPLLQALPRLPLGDVPPSQYHIRKAHRPGQLSTLEATCHALAQLEKDEARYRPLLDAFDGFVAQQSALYMPSGENT